MKPQQKSISLESIHRHLPLTIRESPLDNQIDYIRRKKNQFILLSWVGIVMAVLLAVLTIVTFFLPDIDASDNLLLSILVIVAFAGAAFGNRKMAQRYGKFEARLARESSEE
jgi:hypothetical protein